MDNTSRPSTPEAPPQDLWSSILDSVSSSRSIPSKQILLLGQPSCGKSTLASALLQKPLSDDEQAARRTDFAFGYDFSDVRDEADEDTLARLSVYTVPSANPSYMSLLPHFIPPKSALPHTLVMIVLDWTRPWTFIDDLHVWLEWVETWAKGDTSREVEIAREENRERLQSHLQHYAEPSTDPLPASTSVPGTLLPLGQGSFTHNQAGVPIIVTCTKADLIDGGSEPGPGGMVKGKGGEWEERTDGIMQILRTICLKYGAGLFYTTPLPDTLQVLRQYALHLLFMPPAPSPGLSSGTETVAPLRNIFPFPHKPNTLDRDHIVIPAGWDSWGKITVMREGFEPKLWGEAWEHDLVGEDANDRSAKKLFSALVPDQGAKPTPLPPFNNPMPEQTFLAKHYDENAKRADRDPRGAFRNPADMAGAATGIVGPMGTSSFDLPAVDRALSEMELSSAPGLGQSINGINGTAAGRGGRTVAPTRPAGLATLSTSSAANGRTTTSPSPLSSSTPTSAQLPQHDVLQNFFQSLLRDRPGASPTKPKPNDAVNGSEDGT
ncbi:dynein light intermediate chain family protein [Pleurotus pulmonarius]